MRKLGLLFIVWLCSLTSMLADVETVIYTTEEGAQLKISLSSTANTATVTGLENESFNGSLIIPREITHDGKTFSVVTIGDEAFQQETYGTINIILKEVDLGNVTTIGASAFMNCSFITKMDLSKVKFIGDYAFYNCQKLTSLTFSGSLISVGEDAFDKRVTNVVVNVNDVTEINGLPIPVFSNPETKYYIKGELLTDIIIPEGVESLSGYNQISGINTISLPSSLKEISGNAFTKTPASKIYSHAVTPPAIANRAKVFADYDNTPLYVPMKRKLAYKMADGWKNFTTILEIEGEDVPEYGDTIVVTEAGGLSAALDAVEKEQITNLVIRGKLSAADIKVIRAGEGKLSSLDSLDLKEVTLVPSDEYYYSYSTANDGSFSPNIFRFFISDEVRDEASMGNSLSQANPHYYDHYDPYLSGAFAKLELKRIVMPSCVDRIGIRTFCGSNKLQEVVMPTNPTGIGERAFEGCSLLTIVPDLSKVTDMGERAFNYCPLLMSVDDGQNLNLSSIIDVPKEAFYNCQSIRSVIMSENLVSIGHYAFAGCGRLESVVLSDKTQSIGSYAFKDCSALDKMNLPTSLIRISSNSLSDTPWFKANKEQADGITYLGTIAIEANNSMKKIDFREGTLGIADAFSCSRDVSEVNLPSTLRYLGSLSGTSLTTVSLPDGVEEIGENAFYNSTLKSINIPSSLKMIGQYAFRESGLESISLPQTVDVGNNAFYMCQSLASVYYDIPNTSARWLFESCDNLKEVVLGDHVIEIPFKCFNGCDKLENVEFGSHVQVINQEAFSSCYALKEVDFPDCLREIGEDAFRYCESLSSIKIGKSDVFLGEDAFFYCNGLTSVQILGNGNMEIPKRTFSGCSLLESVVIGDGVKAIGQEAFRRTGVKELVIGCGIETIGMNAFESCQNLISVSIVGNGNTNIEYGGFQDCETLTTLTLGNGIKTLGEGCFANCKELTAVVIPNGVTNIGKSAFYGCNALTEIQIPQGMTEIGESVFSKCISLTSVEISNGVTSINKEAFAGCSALSSITLPQSLSTIESYAFSGCTNLNNVISYILEPFEIDNNVFSKSTYSGTLNVPMGTTDKYKSTSCWNKFTQIVEMDQSAVESISISAAKQSTYCSDKNLDFTSLPELKAYVATGYDKSTGTIWLTRVKDVPANTGFLLVGDAGSYDIPVKGGVSDSYYENLFKGTLSSMTLQATDGANTNYYLSNGTYGIGFYKVTQEGGVDLASNRAYLSVPTDIPSVGTAGGTETINVGSALQMTYCSSNSLDFTDMADVKAYTATGYNYNSGTIWLTRVKKVPAGTGILIMAPQGSYSIPKSSVASVYANMFLGTLSGKTIQTEETIGGIDYINYYLSAGTYGVGFYKVTQEGGVSIGANRSYLPIPKRGVAGTRGISSDTDRYGVREADDVIAIRLFNGEDGAKGIESLENAASKMEKDVFYNLQGQRVVNPGKGLYIKNGKKVVIK